MREDVIRLITNMLPIIERHVTEIKAKAPLTPTDATVLQNYIKTLLPLTKEAAPEDDERLSDDELLAAAKEILEKDS